VAVAKNNSPARFFIKYWLPVLICAILIFYISSIPGDNIPSLFNYQDIFFHILEYAIFAFLVNRALKATKPGLIYIKRFIWVFFLCLIYAIIDELHQAFVPHRHPSLIDITYDGIGICLMSVFYK
jgi:VanZ family protein